MNFDWTQRITGGIVVVFAAYFIAHTLYRKDVPPPAPLQQKSNDNTGLSFSEVRPYRLGLPDVFRVEFGNNTMHINRRLLAEQFPFGRAAGFFPEANIPLSIYFNDDGSMLVNATIYDKAGNILGRIEKNEFALVSENLDRNWDTSAFEIVDETRNPLFQIERTSDNSLNLRGIFNTTTGDSFQATANGVFVNAEIQRVAPLFAYPSTTNLNKRAAP